METGDLKRRSCWNADGRRKNRYYTRKEARFAAKYMSKATNRDYSAYRCEPCDAYHIGSFDVTG